MTCGMRCLRERALVAFWVHIHGIISAAWRARHHRCRHAQGGRQQQQQATTALRTTWASYRQQTCTASDAGCSLPALHATAVSPRLPPQTAGRTCQWCATLWAAARTCRHTCAHPFVAATALCCCTPRMHACWLAPRPKTQGVVAHRRAWLPCLHAGSRLLATCHRRACRACLLLNSCFGTLPAH